MLSVDNGRPIFWYNVFSKICDLKDICEWVDSTSLVGDRQTTCDILSKPYHGWCTRGNIGPLSICVNVCIIIDAKLTGVDCVWSETTCSGHPVHVWVGITWSETTGSGHPVHVWVGITWSETTGSGHPVHVWVGITWSETTGSGHPLRYISA